jgi:hypothetical protein
MSLAELSLAELRLFVEASLSVVEAPAYSAVVSLPV